MDQDGDPMGNLKPEILQVYEVRIGNLKPEILKISSQVGDPMGNLKPEILKEI